MKSDRLRRPLAHHNAKVFVMVLNEDYHLLVESQTKKEYSTKLELIYIF